MSGIFITGTDTGVGKTYVTCALARGLRESGMDIGVMKPVETGVTSMGPEDAIALREAAGVEDPLELICPLQYAMPAAPEAAATAEGKSVSLAAIEEAFEILMSRHSSMLIEGAGGLLVPFDSNTSMADLAKRLGLPVLLVARTSLGTINHTLLSLEACERHDIELLGVVLSHATGELSRADTANLQILRDALGDRLIGELEAGTKGGLPDPGSAGLGAVSKHLFAS